MHFREENFCSTCGQCHFEAELNGKECKLITSKQNGNYQIQISDCKTYFSEKLFKSLTDLNNYVKGINLQINNPFVGCKTC
jgi:hypothetical protein